MLEREKILQWSEIEHDLYEENGHIFGIELDLFNGHGSYYYKHNEQYIYLEGSDIYEAIERFNKLCEINFVEV